ncbi:MAG: diguanylate cyclase with and sensor [bacterium]|nr:diguanylate cyclase with and sensor [bacterium]
MVSTAAFFKLRLATIYWSTAVVGSVATIMLTRSTAVHALAAGAALMLVGVCRGLLIWSQSRKLRTVHSAITNSVWGRPLQRHSSDPFELLLSACDAMLDGLADYHAERTASVDLLSRMLACENEEQLIRVLKRSLRKVFLRDAGAVYFAGDGREQYRRVLSWRMGGSERGSTAPVCFTITMRDRPGEILALYPHPRSMDAQGRLFEHKRLLAEAMARQIGLALSNLQLRARLEAHSVRDALTGLHNRRYFDEGAAHELATAQRNRTPLAVALLDVDHFKRFNDQHGHRAGDAVLRDIGALLQKHTRKSDVLCRYGGEEFVLLLPNASVAQARVRAEALLAAARDEYVRHEGVLLGPVTLSAGIAAWPVNGSTLDAVVEAADAALYQAKRDGRDRVATASVADELEAVEVASESLAMTRAA